MTYHERTSCDPEKFASLCSEMIEATGSERWNGVSEVFPAVYYFTAATLLTAFSLTLLDTSMLNFETIINNASIMLLIRFKSEILENGLELTPFPQGQRARTCQMLEEEVGCVYCEGGRSVRTRYEGEQKTGD